jgi:hypothetical protein
MFQVAVGRPQARVVFGFASQLKARRTMYFSISRRVDTSALPRGLLDGAAGPRAAVARRRQPGAAARVQLRSAAAEMSALVDVAVVAA